MCVVYYHRFSAVCGVLGHNFVKNLQKAHPAPYYLGKCRNIHIDWSANCRRAGVNLAYVGVW